MRSRALIQDSRGYEYIYVLDKLTPVIIGVESRGARLGSQGKVRETAEQKPIAQTLYGLALEHGIP